MTIRGWLVSQSRIACAFNGLSYMVCNLVVAPSAAGGGTTSPCMQLCAVAAEGTRLKVTRDERIDPAGAG